MPALVGIRSITYRERVRRSMGMPRRRPSAGASEVSSGKSAAAYRQAYPMTATRSCSAASSRVRGAAGNWRRGERLSIGADASVAVLGHESPLKALDREFLNTATDGTALDASHVQCPLLAEAEATQTSGLQPVLTHKRHGGRDFAVMHNTAFPGNGVVRCNPPIEGEHT